MDQKTSNSDDDKGVRQQLPETVSELANIAAGESGPVREGDGIPNIGDEQFRTAVENAPVPIIMHAEDGEILQMSRAWTDLTGYTREHSAQIQKWLTKAYSIGGEVPDKMRRAFLPPIRIGHKFGPVEIKAPSQSGSRRTWSFAASIAGVLADGRQFVIAVVDDITERIRVENAVRANETRLAESQMRLAMELSATQRLQEVSSQLISQEDPNDLYKQIMDAAVEITRSQFASIQLFHPERGKGELELICHRGFNEEAAGFWARVTPDSASVCSIALKDGLRLIVPNVEADHIMAGTREQEICTRAGIHAIQTTPLISRTGTMLGMLSTHWRRPHQPAERDLRLHDVLARQAADLIDRKQSEMALRESEARYRTLFDSMDEAYCVVEMLFNTKGEAIDYRFLEANAAFEKLTGWSSISGKRMRELAPEHEQHWFDIYGKVALTGEPIRFVQQANVLDGHWFSLYAFRIGAPDLRRVAVLFADVTDSRRAEEEIRSLARRNQDILESITEGFFALDENWRFTYINRHAEAMLAHEDGSLLGRDLWEAYPGLDETEFGRSYIHTLKTRSPSTFTSFYPEHDRWYEVHAYPASNGITVYFRNVTQRVKNEEAFREAHELTNKQTRIFNTTLSSITDFAYIFDRDGRFVFVNQPLLDLWQLRSEDAVGKNFYELNYPEPLAARLQEQIQYVFDTKESIRDETSFTAASGATGYYEYIFNPVIGADGVVENVAGSTRDVTERKRFEANLAFLDNVGKDFALLSTADEIMQAVGGKIGRYMSLSTCIFCEVDESQNTVTVNYSWSDAGVPSLRQTFSFADYLTPEFAAACRARETFVVRDTALDPRTDSEAYAAIKVRSFVTVPFHREGEWKYYLAVTDSKVRDWRKDEIELFRELSNRIFPRLERAGVEKALRESDERYRTLFNSIDQGFCVLEMIFDIEKPVDYRFIEVNGVFEQMTGISAKAALSGKTAREMVPGLEEKWVELYARVALTGESARFVEGSEAMGRWFDVYACRVGAEDSRRVVLSFTDITERKLAQDSIRFQAQLLNTVEQAAIATDLAGTVIFWNRFAEMLYGWTAVEAVGRKIVELTTPEGQLDHAAEIMSELNQGRSWSGEFTVRRRDESCFPAHVINSPITDDSGALIGIIGVSIDISERKQADEELRRSRESLEERVRERTAELATVNTTLKAENQERQRVEEERIRILQQLVTAQESERRRIGRDLHDQLGQQVTALRLKLEAIAGMAGESSDIEHQVRQAQEYAKEIDADVEFLTFELRPTALDDLGLVAAVRNFVGAWSQNHQIAAEFHTQWESSEMLLPETEINVYRIIQEALNNTLKHAMARHVTVQLNYRDTTGLVLIVEDDGAGFAHEDVDTDSGGRNRMGLIGMRERCLLVGGTLEIESAPGKGTVIFARIPPSAANKKAMSR